MAGGGIGGIETVQRTELVFSVEYRVCSTGDGDGVQCRIQSTWDKAIVFIVEFREYSTGDGASVQCRVQSTERSK